MYKFKNSQINFLKADLGNLTADLYNPAQFSKYFTELAPTILSAFNSNNSTIILNRGWVTVYDKRLSYSNTVEMHTHSDPVHDALFLSHGNHVLIQVLETGKSKEYITVVENGTESDVLVEPGDVLVLPATQMHGLKQTYDRLKVATFAIYL